MWPCVKFILVGEWINIIFLESTSEKGSSWFFTFHLLTPIPPLTTTLQEHTESILSAHLKVLMISSCNQADCFLSGAKVAGTRHQLLRINWMLFVSSFVRSLILFCLVLLGYDLILIQQFSSCHLSCHLSFT